VLVAIPVADRAVDEGEDLVVGVRHAVDEGDAVVRSEPLRAGAVETLELHARAAIALQARIALAVQAPLVVLVSRDDRSERLGADHFALETHHGVRAFARRRLGVSDEAELDRAGHADTQ